MSGGQDEGDCAGMGGSGGVKKKGNGRGLTGVRTGGLGWESGGNSWSGWGDG